MWLLYSLRYGKSLRAGSCHNAGNTEATYPFHVPPRKTRIMYKTTMHYLNIDNPNT